MSKKQGIKVFGIKGSAAGAEISADMLDKINGYALTPLTAEQVYVRKFLMAHSCIDRDNECFPSDILDQFAVTMPGKSLLVGHNRRELPCGKFFAASTEEMTPEQFKSLTGEDPRLPDGADSCKVLWAWCYLVKTAGNEELQQQIDGGVCAHCSIGFAAADIVAVRDNPTGPAKYWQYVSPGEALEGSLVWLGAQPGATAQKALTDQDKHIKEEQSMKTIVTLLVGMGAKALVAESTEEQVAESIKLLFADQTAEIKRLEPLAAEGSAYRKMLVDAAIKFGSLLEEVPSDAEGQKKEADFLATLPLERLKSQADKYEKAAREKFPTHTLFVGKSQEDRNQRQEEGKGKSLENTGKKDFTNPTDNELFKTVGR